MRERKTPIAVLVSGEGRGSNLAALMEACRDERIPGEIVLVVGTRREAPALERAEAGGIRTAVVSPKKYAEDESGYALTLLRVLQAQPIELICLAGYMRRLPGGVLAEYPRKVLNIHPSLLPAFGGRGMYGERVHQAVLESGQQETGCTVLLVDNGYDTGEIVLQRKVSVEAEDTVTTLAARVLAEEHRAYVEAVRRFCRGEFSRKTEGRTAE